MKYIQSLQRAFDILELVSNRPDKEHALGDIARDTGLHPATCSHLINTMAERGYLKQAGPRKGYQLGPMAYYVVRNATFRHDLIVKAEPLLRQTAELLREWVVLAALAGTRRMVLLEVSGTGNHVCLDRQAVRLAESAYNAASTWVFLAYMGDGERERFLDRHGFPKGYEANAALNNRLATVRETGYAIYEDPGGEVAKVAFPVKESGVVTAVVGVYLPAFRFEGDHRRQVIEETGKLAGEVSC